jgi:HSP20 family protein
MDLWQQNERRFAMGEIRVRDPFWGGFSNLPAVFQRFFEQDDWGLPTMSEGGLLAVDISEGKEGETIVRASLPGFRREDVQVSVQNGVLDIKAENRFDEETKGEKFYRRERRYGSVTRRIALPGNPTGEGVAAELKEGVLTVKVPANGGNGPKKIQVR